MRSSEKACFRSCLPVSLQVLSCQTLLDLYLRMAPAWSEVWVGCGVGEQRSGSLALGPARTCGGKRRHFGDRTCAHCGMASAVRGPPLRAVQLPLLRGWAYMFHGRGVRSIVVISDVSSSTGKSTAWR